MPKLPGKPHVPPRKSRKGKHWATSTAERAAELRKLIQERKNKKYKKWKEVETEEMNEEK